MPSEKKPTARCSASQSTPLCPRHDVVEDDDVAWLEGGRELGFDAALEDHPIHRDINDPGAIRPSALEARHEGLRAPMAEGSLAVQPSAFC